MPAIDLAQGIIWGHRLLLNRDPADQPTVDAMVALVASPEEVRSLLIGSVEYAEKFEQVRRDNGALNFPMDLREGILWGYRLIFQQEPREEQVAIQLPRVSDVPSVRNVFVMSREFELRRGFGAPELHDYEVLRHFAPFHTIPGRPGSFADFLEATTRTSFLPDVYRPKSATLEGGPYSRARGMHGDREWIATLRSMTEAQDQVVASNSGLGGHRGWSPARSRRGSVVLRLSD